MLSRVFVEENVCSIPATELAGRLDDELYAHNERVPYSFPKPAKAYLDDWAAAESGWLRKYYPGIATLTAQRAALRYYFADHKARLLDGLLAELDSERTRLAGQPGSGLLG